MGKIKLCALCKNSRETSSLFSVPKNPEISKNWIEIITSFRRSSKISPEKGVICSNHFADDCFQCPTNKSRLLLNAVPTLLLIPHNDEEEPNDDDGEGDMESGTDSDDVDISNLVDVELNQSSPKNCNEEALPSNNWSDLCRICLQNAGEMTNIFEVTINSLNISLPELFSSFTALQMEQIDGFPTQICTSCQDILVTSYEFQLKCIKSDHDIRVALGYSPQKSAIEVKFEQNCIFVNEDTFPDCFDGNKIKDEPDELDGIIDDIPEASNNDEDDRRRRKVSTDNEETSSESEENDAQPAAKMKKKKKVYRCMICNKNFDKPSTLLRHQKIHDPEGKPYECKFCKRRFAEERRKICHEMTHLDNKSEAVGVPVETSLGQNKVVSYSSEDDDSDYLPERNVKKEVVNVKTEKCADDPVKVENVSFNVLYVTEEESGDDGSSGSEYAVSSRHKKTGKSPKERKLTCNICDKTFSKQYHLMRHGQIHNPEGRPYECKICKRRFAIEAHMTRHELNHSDELRLAAEVKPAIYKCTECQREFLKPQALATHMNIHKNVVKPKIFSCKYCEKIFPSLRKLTRHIRTHDELKIHRCHICDKAYAARGELADHIKFKHEGIAPYVCTLCDKGFQHLYAHTAHMRSHSGETPFLCSDCGKGFSEAHGLKQHMKYHSAIKPFQCTECPRQFHTNSILKGHLLTHSGIKPHTCDTCGASFTARISLRMHIRMHTGERPYICKVCGKGFIASGILVRHMRTHTGEKPYKCEFCGRAFADKCDLNKHKRRLHVEFKAFNCEECQVAFRLHKELRKHNKELHKPKPKSRPRKKKLVEPKNEPIDEEAILLTADALASHGSSMHEAPPPQ